MVADLRIYHVPVLLNEVMDAIRPRAGGRYIDATLGEGGYSEAIVAAHGEVLGMDADPAMMPIAARRLDHFSSLSYTLVQANFSSMASVADSLGFEEVDGIFMDLGLSYANSRPRPVASRSTATSHWTCDSTHPRKYLPMTWLTTSPKRS